VPIDYQKIMENHTSEGYRVIAIATKELVDFTNKKVQSVKRDHIESELTFIGFLVLEKELKPCQVKL
jgi:cation-transporting ATPase 13A1